MTEDTTTATRQARLGEAVSRLRAELDADVRICDPQWTLLARGGWVNAFVNFTHRGTWHAAVGLGVWFEADTYGFNIQPYAAADLRPIEYGPSAAQTLCALAGLPANPEDDVMVDGYRPSPGSAALDVALRTVAEAFAPEDRKYEQIVEDHLRQSTAQACLRGAPWRAIFGVLKDIEDGKE